MVSAARINRLTAFVTEYRLWRHIRRAQQLKALENYVAIEIKGLKAKALKAASNMDRLNQAYDKFNEAAPAHAMDVEGLTPQIEGLAEDLAFAAQVLGNSVAGSSAGATEKPAKGSTEEIAGLDAEREKLPPAHPEGQQTASHQPGS